MWAKKQDIESCSDLLASFISNSETKLKAHYKNCYPEAEFYRLPELVEKVNSLSIHANSKDLMITLVENIHQGATTDQALCEMEAAGANPKTLLKCFSKAYLCPVPLRKNFCAKKLPNPTYLLYCTSENPVPIAYIRSK